MKINLNEKQILILQIAMKEVNAQIRLLNNAEGEFDNFQALISSICKKINISDYNFTIEELSLIKYGLDFIWKEFMLAPKKFANDNNMTQEEFQKTHREIYEILDLPNNQK